MRECVHRMCGFRRLQMIRVLLMYWRLLAQHTQGQTKPEGALPPRRQGNPGGRGDAAAAAAAAVASRPSVARVRQLARRREEPRVLVG